MTLDVPDQMALRLGFRDGQGKWVVIGCIVWRVESSTILTGFYTISKEFGNAADAKDEAIMNSYRIPIKETIQE